MLQVYVTPLYVMICQMRKKNMYLTYHISVKITHSYFADVASDTWPLHMSSYVKLHKYVSHISHRCIITHFYFAYVASVRDPFIYHDKSDKTNVHLTCLIIATWHIHISQDQVRHDWVWLDSFMWKSDTGDTYIVAIHTSQISSLPQFFNLLFLSLYICIYVYIWSFAPEFLSCREPASQVCV